jgi:hypothetical protein
VVRSPAFSGEALSCYLRETLSDAHERADEDKVLFRWQSAYGSAKAGVKFKLNLAGADHFVPVGLVCPEGQARPGTLIVTENLLALWNACLQIAISAHTAPSEKVLYMT